MRIYLDNAATSWPKPEAVYRAVEHYQRQLGAPSGRSSYAEAAQVARLLDQARRRLAMLLGVRDRKHIIFTTSGTDSLNLAIHGVLRPGDHVIATSVEHNSILRPLRHLEENAGVLLTIVDCDGQGVVDPDEVRRAMRKETRLVCVSHASNVTGALQPVAEIGHIAHEGGALLLVDAAQTLGHTPFSVDDLGVDLLAAPGHKGLLGPLGVGLLYIRPGVEQNLRSIRQGGTGTESDDDRQPTALPDKYESGNLNVPGIIGLHAALGFLETHGVEAVRARCERLSSRFTAGLADIAGVKLYGPQQCAQRVGLVSVSLEGYDPQEAAAALDAAYHIQVRAGLHCAPRMHLALGSAPAGAVRFSWGWFTTDAEIDLAVAAVAELVSASLPL